MRTFAASALALCVVLGVAVAQAPQKPSLTEFGCPVGTFTGVVLNDEDVPESVPAAAHHRRVTAAVTEQRLLRF